MLTVLAALVAEKVRTGALPVPSEPPQKTSLARAWGSGAMYANKRSRPTKLSTS